MALATRLDTETLALERLREDVERWFERHGVPHFSDTYTRGRLLRTIVSTLAVVLAFEVTALPWLEMTPAGVTAALTAILAVLFVVVPLLHHLWEPSEVDWWGIARGLLLRAGALVAAGIALSATPLPGLGWHEWLDFAFFVVVLFAAIVLVRGRRLETLGRPRLLVRMAVAAVVLVEFFALEGTVWPTMSGLTGIDAPASLFAMPAAAGFLAVSIAAATAPPAERGARRWRSAFGVVLPVLFVTLGVQITMLPWASTPREIDLFVPLAIAGLMSQWPTLVRWRRLRGVRRWLRTHRRTADRLGIALGALLFLCSLPLYVEHTIAETATLTWQEALLLNGAGLVLTVVVVGNALDRIAKWMAGEVLHDLPATFGAFVGSLPMIVLLLFFVAITTETWEVATQPAELGFAALLGALLLLTLAIALRTCLRELRDHFALAQWTDVREAIAEPGRSDRPPPRVLHDLLRRVEGETGAAPEPELRLRERINATSVMMVSQLIYCAAIGVFTTVLFYLLAKLAVSSELLVGWQVAVPEERLRDWGAEAEQFGRWPLFNQPWSRVALLLGAFSALAFAAHVASGDGKRETFFSGPDREVRRRLAVRLAYRRVFDV